jgi:hypothetical protein
MNLMKKTFMPLKQWKSLKRKYVHSKILISF